MLFLLFILSLVLFSSQPAFAEDMALTPLTDEEMGAIQASGFYFRMDMSMEVFTASDTPPQVVLNTGTFSVPTDSTTQFAGPAGSISLSGSAQGNISSLINVIGAASVINVGVNVVSINTSTNDSIYNTNVNTGAQGSNFSITVPILP